MKVQACCAFFEGSRGRHFLAFFGVPWLVSASFQLAYLLGRQESCVCVSIFLLSSTDTSCLRFVLIQQDYIKLPPYMYRYF